MVETLFAKSGKDCGKNKYLLQHTKMVINLGMFIGDKIFNEYNEFKFHKRKEKFLTKLSIALSLHDIGKCSNEYQNLFKKNNKISFTDDNSETYCKNITIPHNVYSWAYLINNFKETSQQQYKSITSAVLYHHIVSSNETNSSEIISNLSDKELDLFDSFFNEIKEYVKTTFNIVFPLSYIENKTESSERDITGETLYGLITSFNRDEILFDTEKSLIRACVIYSDRFISSGKYDEEKILNNDINYLESIFNELQMTTSINDIEVEKCGYDKDRLKVQQNIVENILSSNNHNVIGANAGFGKTLTGLLWFLKEKKKFIWVVPRNVIADGTYDSIIKELIKLQQTNVKVVLYRSGEVIKSNYNANDETLSDADILVTNIDSILNRVIKNNMSKYLINLYSSNIIFDEYHELFCDEPLFATFIRLILTRTLYTNSKTLFLSATPSKFDCFFDETTKDVIKYYDHKIIPIHNGDMKMNISYKEYNRIEDLNIVDKDTFIITNTVRQSQNSYDNNNINGSMLIHTWFTEKDRNKIEQNIFNNHDKNSIVENRNLVVGTNIIGVGLDISAKNIYDFVITPENTIQRGCGRGGRFNEKEYNNEINYNICVIKNSKSNKKLIGEIFDNKLHEKWIEVLKTLDGKTIMKKDMYDLYSNFYKEHKKEVNELYKKFFKNGSKMLNEFKPSSVKNKKEKSYKTLSTGLSYRGYGENIYVNAKDDTDNWCESISINKNYINEEERYIHPKIKKEIVTNYSSYNKYEFEHYGLKSNGSYIYDNLIKIAFRSDRPYPLLNYKYNAQKGLYYTNNDE